MNQTVEINRTVVIRRLATLAAIVLAMVALAAPAAWAKTFTVDSKANPGSGVCNATECTLKEAVNEANANGESDLINFAAGLSGEIDLRNTAAKGGFSILNDAPEFDLTINGPGAGVLAINGNNETRAFGIAGGANATINGLTIKNGKAHHSNPSGGGISSSGTLALTNTTVRGNTATNGGGIHNSGTGTMTLTNTTVRGNTATSSAGDATGGGIYNSGTMTLSSATVSGNHTATSSGSSNGGGIHTSGTMTIDRTTVSGNTATSSSGSSHGGGIHNPTTMTLTNTTVSGNTASGIGGGIENGGPLTLTHVTLNGNSAPASANLSHFNSNPVMRATIIANPHGGGANCAVSTGAITSRGYNLEFPGTSCGLEVQGNPKLARLANNGGSTKTHALQAGSAAIDQVPSSDEACPPPESDQRGVLRPQDGDGNGDPLCDIGAYEKKPR